VNARLPFIKKMFGIYTCPTVYYISDRYNSIYVTEICGNQAFPEMPMQLQNEISMVFILTMFKIWEKAEH